MIGYYLHHHGSGHARRATAVASHLRHEVVGLGSGGRPEGWPGEWVELARDDHPAVDAGAADVEADGVFHWVPRHHAGLLARHRQVLDWLDRARPSLVVVDVSVEITTLVRLSGTPVVVGAMPGRRTDRPHTLAHDLAEAILAPWPAGAHPDAGWPDAWLAKTWHVGGISALPPAAEDGGDGDGDGDGVAGAGGAEIEHGGAVATEPDVERRVLVLWGAGGADLDRATLAAARAATPGWRWEVRGGGHPLSPDLVQDLRDADVVVCHAGQGSVADVALLRRPAVVLAQPRPFEEQEATARALDRLGLAVTDRGWPAAERWPDLLERAHRLGGERWALWGGDGATTAAAHLDALADRLGRPTPESR